MAKTFRNFYMTLEREPRLAFYVRSCGYFNLIPPEREQYRYQVDFGEIFWCIRGSAVFRQNSRETILTADHAWYYPPNSNHDYYPRKEGFEYRFLTIAGSGASTLFSGLDIRQGMSYAGSCPQDLFSLVELNMGSTIRTSRMRAISRAA